MSIFGSLLQTIGFLVTMISLWMIGGIWIFCLGAGVVCAAMGVALELAARAN